MNNEVWKDVVGYESLYQVSNLGRVKRIKSKVAWKDGFMREQPEKVLKTRPSNKGYPIIQLCRESKIKAFTVHRLVALAFIEKSKPELTDINHINGIKDDNRVVNLEWVSRRQNTVHAIENGLLNCVDGRCLTTQETKDKINAMRKSGLSKNAISKNLNISRHTVIKYANQ